MAHFALVSFYDTICKGVRYLSAALKKSSHQVTVIHFKNTINKDVLHSQPNSKHYYIYVNGFVTSSGFDSNPHTQKEILLLTDLVAGIRPDILAISTRACYLDICQDLIGKIKSSCPEIITLAGGFGPTFNPEAFAKVFDYICYGEGENLIREVGQAVDSKRGDRIHEIGGIGFWDQNGQLNLSRPATPVLDLDQIPYPDLPGETDFLIESGQVVQGLQIDKPSRIELFASRGCPASCSYCSTGQLHDRYQGFRKSSLHVPKVRLRSPAGVIDEIQTTIEQYQEKTNQAVNRVVFLDSIFGFQQKWLNEFCELYAQKINLPFQANTDIRFHSIEMIAALWEAGLCYTTFSVQSGSERIREQIFNRKISNDALIETAWWLHRQNNLLYDVDLLGFNPFETETTLKETFGFLCHIPPTTNVIVYRLIIQANTRLDRLYQENPPPQLSDEEHETWIYLWHMAARGGREREVAQRILEETKYVTPMRFKEDLEKMFYGEPDVTFTLNEQEELNLSWPYALNLNRLDRGSPAHHWLTVSQRNQGQVPPLLYQHSNEDSKFLLRVENDFLCLCQTIPFAYLCFVGSQDSTKGHDLRNAVLRMRHFADRLDLKGGKIHFFVEHSLSNSRWVLNGPFHNSATAMEKVLVSEAAAWTRISGNSPLEPILAGNSGELGYTHFGFMAVGISEQPTGAWGLSHFSLGPLP